MGVWAQHMKGESLFLPFAAFKHSDTNQVTIHRRMDRESLPNIIKNEAWAHDTLFTMSGQ